VLLPLTERERERESDVWLLKKDGILFFIFKRKTILERKKGKIRVGWFVNNTHTV
jgi:hypothetical protein